MKKLILSMLMLAILFSVLACGEKIEPLENPQSELFSTFYEGDGFTILKRTEIDPDVMYELPAFSLKSEKGTSCIIGSEQMDNYLVLYNEEYYNVQDGTYLNLYTGNELINLGVGGSCTED
jgi:hypothetical protein